MVVTNEERVAEAVQRSIWVGTWNRLLDLVDSAYNWGRRSSLWPLQFGLACCAMEMISSAASRFDFARFGAEIFRGSPRQADLMIVSGTVTKKMMPQISRLYEQMAEPKYVISMGACASGGGPFKEGYNVVSGVDKYIPVDVYVPGCPPTPQALLHALMTLQAKIEGQSIRDLPWYSGPKSEFPIPVLGPDILDPNQFPDIKTWAAQAAAVMEAAGSEEEEEGEERRLPAKVAEVPETTLVAVAELADRLVRDLGEGAAQAEGARLVVERGRLEEVARHLRDTPDLFYNYLHNLTSADYPDHFDVAYHVSSLLRGGAPIELVVQADKADPAVPSLVDVWRGADFQEREVWDLMGIHFEGHPNLKRILLWEGFEGHPLRKDWQEPYYEEDQKPFASRWPEGDHMRGEERVRWGKNVQYPAGFDPTAFEPPSEEYELVDVEELPERELGTGKLVVNMGPQHPSTHGVFRMVVTLDGESVVELKPVMGYLHRNHEKIGERNMWLMNMPYTDRLDYLAAMANNFGYAIAVEKLMGVEVPERAEYLRVIMAELTRVVRHLWGIGFLLNDLGATQTPALYAIEERELVLDIFEAVAGSRIMCNYFRFGGVSGDVPDEWMDFIRQMVTERLPRAVGEFDSYLSGNEIVLARMKGVGVLSRDDAINFSASGPVLRASGVEYDVRRAEPYSIYDRFEFDIPTGTNGDIYDRYWVRLQEVYQSLRILRQALDQIPDGEVEPKKKAWQIRVPAGEVYGRVEIPAGELGFFLVSDGGANPYRYHIRSPSFINLTALEHMCKGHKVADVVGILGSIDIVLGEVDR